mmetsp:Transcript_29642/g.60901  ORF Transcript_29642/g.60901 Transcript_29642/m.60901 type:complete len:102 (-) Transcript_29642:33-338(-)
MIFSSPTIAFIIYHLKNSVLSVRLFFSFVSLAHLWLNDNGFTDGMNNFCLEGGPSLAVFYSDCLGRSFPPIVPQVQCSCCTICCAENPKTEPCLLNGGTLP